MGRKRNSIVFNIPEQLTIKDIGKYHNDFSKAVKEGRTIVVDLIKTNSIDFSGLQLLNSLKKTCKEKQLDITLENINKKISDQIILCGLRNSLLKETSHGSI